jgi:hypothetical protein
MPSIPAIGKITDPTNVRVALIQGQQLVSAPLQQAVSASMKAASYTVATAPDASTAGAGAIIYVSDEAGGAVLAYSDGTNWRRVTDRTVVS